VILIYTVGALLVGLLAAILVVAAFLVAPRTVIEQGWAVTVGLSVLLATVPVERSGLRSRFFFVPTYLWGLGLLLFGFVSNPTVAGLLSTTAAGLAALAIWALLLKRRQARSVTHAGELLAKSEASSDPFEAVELAAAAVLPLSRPTPEQRQHNRAALKRIVELASNGLDQDQLATLRAFDAELVRLESAAGDGATDDALLSHAMTVVDRIRQSAKSGTLNPNGTSVPT